MRLAAWAVLASLAAAAVAAPLLGSAGAPVYAAFAWICHQRPERSWEVAGRPLAVCVRCFGIYTGALAAAIGGRRFRRLAALAAFAGLALDWALEAAGLLGPRPLWRFWIGFAAGALAAPALWAEPHPAGMRRIWVRRKPA
jgi:hypothetical protein